MKVDELIKLCRYDIDENIKIKKVEELRNPDMYIQAREEYDYLEQLQTQLIFLFIMLIKYIQHADLRKDERYINWIHADLSEFIILFNTSDEEFKELFLDYMDEKYIRELLFDFFDIDYDNPLYANLTVNYLIVQGKYKQFLVDHNENSELHDRIWLM